MDGQWMPDLTTAMSQLNTYGEPNSVVTVLVAKAHSMTRTFDPFDELAAMFLTVPPGSEVLPAPPPLPLAPAPMPIPAAAPASSAAVQCAPGTKSDQRLVNRHGTTHRRPPSRARWVVADAVRRRPLARDIGSTHCCDWMAMSRPCNCCCARRWDAASAGLESASRGAIGEVAALIETVGDFAQSNATSKPGPILVHGGRRTNHDLRAAAG
jgi:hypothetical protein